MNSVRQRLHALNRKLESGEVDPDEWADAFDELLLEGHRDAVALGRARAGAEPLGEDELLIAAREAKDTEADFLQGFVDAIKSGDSRYFDDDGNLRPGSLDPRTTLYVGKMRGTANQSFLDGSEDDADFVWKLGATERHCEDCPRIAAQSPFTKDTIIAIPGNGDTECLGHCDCVLERADGVAGFERASWDEQSEDDAPDEKSGDGGEKSSDAPTEPVELLPKTAAKQKRHKIPASSEPVEVRSEEEKAARRRRPPAKTKNTPGAGSDAPSEPVDVSPKKSKEKRKRGNTDGGS